MEALTRLVTESLARHGFDRPLDYRRLHWSRWFRCESHHSLLLVPSKPGVFALAEEITNVATAAKPALSAVEGAVPPARSVAESLEGHDFTPKSLRSEVKGAGTTGITAPTVGANRPEPESRRPEEASDRRLLAVTQFFEDDDMAYVLDRMLSRNNPMRARLTSGRYFVRFVVIEDQTQRRSIWAALNQWMASAADKASGIGSHFASSLELNPATEFIPEPDPAQKNLFGNPSNKEDVGPTRVGPTLVGRTLVGRTLLSVSPDSPTAPVATAASPVPQTRSESQGSSSEIVATPGTSTAPHITSGAATNIHCPAPFPSGF